MKKFISTLIILFIIVSFCGCSKDVKKEKIKLTIGKDKTTGFYTGTLNNNKANGKGVFESTYDGTTWTYKGSFRDNKIHGNGYLTSYPLALKYGDSLLQGYYTGETKNGAITGNGEFKNSKESLYTITYKGSFKNGSLSGTGYLRYNGLVLDLLGNHSKAGYYEGATLNGLPHGKGSYTLDSRNFNNSTTSNSSSSLELKYRTTRYVGSFSKGNYNGLSSKELNLLEPKLGSTIKAVKKYEANNKFTSNDYNDAHGGGTTYLMYNFEKSQKKFGIVPNSENGTLTYVFLEDKKLSEVRLQYGKKEKSSWFKLIKHLSTLYGKRYYTTEYSNGGLDYCWASQHDCVKAMYTSGYLSLYYSKR